MDLSINAGIECTDGGYGHSTAIILNPINNQVTHIVVREPGLLGVERMLPVEFVTSSTPEVIRLRCTQAELTEMPLFATTSYIPAMTDSQSKYSEGTMLWPYVGMQSGVAIEHENIAPEALAVHRGSHVHATDGHIGEVEEFIVSSLNNGITHVILREGHFWNRQDVTIPVKDIDHIADDTVFLKLNKHQIQLLPAIAVQRRQN